MNRKWLIHVKKFFQDGIKCKKRNIIIRKRKNTFKTTIIFILWSFIYTSRKDSFGLNNTKSLNNAGTGSYRHLDRIILIEREYWAHFPNTYRDIYRSIFWFVPIQTTGLKIKTKINPNTFIQCFLRNAKTCSIIPLLFLEKIHVRDSQKFGASL